MQNNVLNTNCILFVWIIQGIINNLWTKHLANESVVKIKYQTVEICYSKI